MPQRFFETLIGAVVLCAALGFLGLTAQMGFYTQKEKGYSLDAFFDRVDGLLIGSDVRIAGVKVGSVKSIVLNPQTYRAHISLTIKSDIQIPEESAIQVVSDGLLGGKHLAISPNVSKIFMKPGDTIENTQSSVNLESLLSKFMFNAPENKK